MVTKILYTYLVLRFEFVNSKCNKWIGCRGTVDWPANSPDVRPCDFSLWAINCE